MKQHYLRNLFFYVEPKTLSNKDIRHYNSFLFNFILDQKNFSDINCFFITIDLRKDVENEQTYAFYWAQLENIITVLDKFCYNIPECIFFLIV